MVYREGGCGVPGAVHFAASLYNGFSPSEARLLVSKIELHYALMHVSRLNIVEIMIAVLRTMRLNRRIDQRAELLLEI